MKNVSETLAGRAAVLHLYPFMIEEITGNYMAEEKDIENFLRKISLTWISLLQASSFIFASTLL